MGPAPPRRTLLLRERTATECRLAAEDVAFLLARHRTHLELLPAGRRGRYRLTPAGYVGTLTAPTCRLVIRPKLPLHNLFYLLDPAAPPPVTKDAATAPPGTEALDFLAGRLAQLLAERAAAGLHRAYAEHSAEGRFLHGRLDVQAQMRSPPGRKDLLHSRYEEFSTDVPCNQVPRATADLVLRSPLVAEAVRAAVARAVGPFAGVRSVALDPEAFSAAAPDRLTEAYRPLLDLCRLLADSLSPAPDAGPVPCPAFLLDMERIFERYVSRGVVEAFAADRRRRVEVQPLYRMGRPTGGGPGLALRPDLVVFDGETAVLVADTKWKRLAKALLPPDLYQVVAYGTALGARRAVLIYPGRRDRAWTYALPRAPLDVVIHTLQVVGPRERCLRSLRRLGRSLRRTSR
jgi:5-methylcytosine-specific restriction enzyme subunit McrC